MNMFHKWKERKIPSALLTFAVGMVALTVLAGVADSFMLPVVTVTGFEPMTLEYPVKIAGRIESEGTEAMYAKENLRVEKVEVQEGDLVNKGDVIFTYDMGFLDEKIRDSKKELKKMTLQYESAKNNEQLALDRKNQSIGRAGKDYQDAMNAAGFAENAAYQDMEAARLKFESVRSNPPVIQRDLEPVFGDGTTFEDEPETDSSEKLLKAWEAEKEMLYQDYIMKKRAYNDTLRAGAESKKNARRQVEDAKAPSEADSSLELQELDMQDLKEELQELLDVKESGGKVLAKVDGKVSRINVETGSITGTDAAVMVEDFSKPFRFEGTMDEKAAEYVSTGMACNLRLKESKGFVENQIIDKVTEVENGQMSSEFLRIQKVEAATVSV